MRNSLILLFVFIFCFITASSQDIEVGPLLSSPTFITGQSIEGQWDILFNYDATAVTSAAGNAGAIYIPTLQQFWTSRWQTAWIHRWTKTGTLIDSFQISSVSGTRSMTWNGTHVVHGNNTGTLSVVDPVTRTRVSTITLPTSPSVTARYVTYDPTANNNNGGYWCGNWNTGNLHFYLVSTTGTLLRTINNTAISGIYGAAWDGISTDGPYLWVWSQGLGAPNPQLIHQIRISTGLATGVTKDVRADVGIGQPSTTGIAGGLFISDQIVSGKAVIGGLLQGTPDRLFGYELASTTIDSVHNIGVLSLGSGQLKQEVDKKYFDRKTALQSEEKNVEENEITITSIIHGQTVYNLESQVSMKAIVKNFGVFIENSYQVGWSIDGVPQTAVSNTRPLAVGGQDTFNLVWNNPTSGQHSARAWTILATDTIRSNDTSAVYNFEVLPGNVILHEGFNGTTFPPTGWITINRDGGGTTGPWFRSTGASTFPPYEGAAYAADNYQSANGFYIDDYLITPNTGGTYENTTVDSLTFWLRSPDNSQWPDSLDIRVSTTGTGVNDFTTRIAYIKSPITGWKRFAFALPNAATRYIAFRYLIYNGGQNGTNSDFMGLDDVRIIRHGSTPLPTDYKIALTIKNANNTNTGVINFGGHQNAAYCIDDTLGEFELPPKPPTDVFDVRFIDNRTGAGKCMGEGISLDLRPWLTVTTKDTFRVSLQPGGPGYPMTITWPTGLNAYFNSAEIREVGGTQVVDMLTTNQLIVEEDAVASVRIYTDVKPRGSTGVGDNASEIPTEFSLSQNYPNPFNPMTNIGYSLPVQSVVQVEVYNVLGQKVRTLVNESKPAGNYTVQWNGTDDRVQSQGSGVYFVRISANGEQNKNFNSVRKIMMLK